MPKRTPKEAPAKKTRKTRSDKGMSKRARGDSLTGGTGDVNPQTLTIGITQTTADNGILVQQALPIPRYPQKNGKSIVMEILKVDFLRETYLTAATESVQVLLTTNPAAPLVATTPADMSAAVLDPRWIAAAWVDLVLSSAVGFADQSRIYSTDLTDQAGHGYLVATDNLYLALRTITTAQINSFICRITYRFKEVSLAAYVGIVQSQQ
jgi:hypothetical protein